MSQSKKQSHVEVITNNLIGILVGWLIVAYILMPLGKIFKPDEVATISTAIFFCTSYTRAYIIRRLFDRHTSTKRGKEA